VRRITGVKARFDLVVPRGAGIGKPETAAWREADVQNADMIA
jgi:hypothetical protein